MILTIPFICDILTLQSGSGIFITKTRALSMCSELYRSLIATERSPFCLEVFMVSKRKKEYQKKWMLENKERVKELWKNWYAKNKTTHRKKRLKYYYKNREKYLLNNKTLHRKTILDKCVFGGNREKAIIRDNYTCQACGYSKGKARLDVHHKDLKGLSVLREERNNLIENLLTLCHSCHMKYHRSIERGKI